MYQHFPRLEERAKQIAGTLSGGEQQMLAIGRALMSTPKLLLMDEPSMGLSPILVKEIFSIIEDMHKEGITILLVEQNAKMALSIANRAYVLETGKIAMSGTAHDLLDDEKVRRAYLGTTAARRMKTDASLATRSSILSFRAASFAAFMAVGRGSAFSCSRIGQQRVVFAQKRRVRRFAEAQSAGCACPTRGG